MYLVFSRTIGVANDWRGHLADRVHRQPKPEFIYCVKIVSVTNFVTFSGLLVLLNHHKCDEISPIVHTYCLIFPRS